ncbi:MAG: carbon-nitrogen hydrolase family protein [Thiolinea sp.]
MTNTTHNNPTHQQLTMLACQIYIPAMTTARERDEHLCNSASKLQQALMVKPADLVVLPELSSIDYSRATFEALNELAEPLNGPSFQTWQAVAKQHKTTIVYSFPRRSVRGLHISLAVVNPQGDLIGYYDKIHLAQYGASMEKEYFTPGQQLLVFEVKGFRLAPIICYDIRIPELSRTLTLDHGVDAILHCGAYYRDESFHTWHAFATTRAIENQLYFLSLNRAGQHYGNSLFCQPWMDENQQPQAFPQHNECLKHLVLKRDEIIRARSNYSFLTDRLDTYQLQTNGNLP